MVLLHHLRGKEIEVRGYDARTDARDRYGQDCNLERRLGETGMPPEHHGLHRTTPRIPKWGFKVPMQNRSRMSIEKALDVLCLIEGAMLLLRRRSVLKSSTIHLASTSC